MSASRELLAPRDDVWEFVAEPFNLPHWWPRVGGVQPDRRGLAPGARWQVQGQNQPSLFRRPEAVGTLQIIDVQPPRRLAFQLTGDRLHVELELEDRGAGRSAATISIDGPFLIGLSRSLPKQVLARLHALCQTGAA